MTDGLLGGIEPCDRPWRDEDVLRELYLDEELSQNQIADKLGCAASTVSNWLDEFDIPTRSIREGKKVRHDSDPVHYSVRSDGRALWTDVTLGVNEHVYVHRLAAVAKYGVDAVADNDVHHKNGCRWDNRLSNLEVMSHSEHTTYHKSKLAYTDRLAIFEFYRNGECSTYDLAELYPVGQGQISHVINQLRSDG